MRVRHTKLEELDKIQEIILKAIVFMRSYGNTEQWNDADSIQDKVLEDIILKRSYVVVDKDNQILGTFMFSLDKEPTYNKIKGKWLNEKPYGVIHRIASSGIEKGVLKKALEFGFKQTDNIRIDTHKDNLPMRHLLDKYGFTYCGEITLENKQKRRAYQKIK